MKLSSVIIFAAAFVTSSPLVSRSMPQGAKSLTKGNQNPKNEQNQGPLCGQNDGQCLRMFGLSKLQSGGRFRPKMAVKKLMNMASNSAYSFKTMMYNQVFRGDHK
ncbi:hypothetical protein DSO57_1013198 [Entomophthora muscae]|uniref:Uncharacterized protein n=1 Tax=Entomophthora muscae TaxID=34485 RepID=A0ACC2S7S8_9FUNG|nr:hypothetical protein DSO57_1013198 [Entomophthora muscae]